MFDCCHAGRIESDVAARLGGLLPIIGHIQFGSVPDRGTPDHSYVNYPKLFARIEAAGWVGPLGSEYKPAGPTGASLHRLAGFRA